MAELIIRYLAAASDNRSHLASGRMRPEVKRWQEEIAARVCHGVGLRLAGAPVRLTLTLVRGANTRGRNPDTSNVLKVVQDAVARGLSIDDNQIEAVCKPCLPFDGCGCRYAQTLWTHLHIGIEERES